MPLSALTIEGGGLGNSIESGVGTTRSEHRVDRSPRTAVRSRRQRLIDDLAVDGHRRERSPMSLGRGTTNARTSSSTSVTRCSPIFEIGDVTQLAFDDPASRLRLGDFVDTVVRLDRLHLFDSRTGRAIALP